jgi:hypothetical protein
MSIESTIILENISSPSQDLSAFTYTDKFKGTGYYRKASGVQTFQFDITDFKGSVIVQGTLERYPGEADWINLSFDSGDVIAPSDSTASSGAYVRNISGNWLWIRVGYVLEEGTIDLIRYNI